MMHGTRMYGPATAKAFRGADLSGSQTRAMNVLWHPDPDRKTVFITGLRPLAPSPFQRGPRGVDIVAVGRRLSGY
jgi:hypothetical protein